jgi:hypothetical protein
MWESGRHLLYLHIVRLERLSILLEVEESKIRIW